MERSGDEGRQHDQSESITTTNENSETDTNLPVGGGSERHEQNGSDVAENESQDVSRGNFLWRFYIQLTCFAWYLVNILVNITGGNLRNIDEFEKSKKRDTDREKDEPIAARKDTNCAEEEINEKTTTDLNLLEDDHSENCGPNNSKKEEKDTERENDANKPIAAGKDAKCSAEGGDFTNLNLPESDNFVKSGQNGEEDSKIEKRDTGREKDGNKPIAAGKETKFVEEGDDEKPTTNLNLRDGDNSEKSGQNGNDDIKIGTVQNIRKFFEGLISKEKRDNVGKKDANKPIAAGKNTECASEGDDAKTTTNLNLPESDNLNSLKSGQNRNDDSKKEKRDTDGGKDANKPIAAGKNTDCAAEEDDGKTTTNLNLTESDNSVKSGQNRNDDSKKEKRDTGGGKDANKPIAAGKNTDCAAEGEDDKTTTNLNLLESDNSVKSGQSGKEDSKIAIAIPERECPEPEDGDQSSHDLTTPDKDQSLSSQIVQPNSCLNFEKLIRDSKFSLKQAQIVDNQTLNDLTSPHQVPKYMLRALMMVDYRAREFELKSLTTDKDKDNNKTNNTDNCDESGKESKEGVNPMDGLLWIFHCSDAILRRTLAIKLSKCQLSVPFLLPDPAYPSKNITILLSALQNITKCWKSSTNENAQEVFATEHSFPVVSFIRLGEVTRSKSKLINKIMSDKTQYHEFFFHKNMEGGNVERKIVDGLVELCWYLPDESQEQTLQNGICFANLRGDAGRFRKQLDVLLKVSSVLCVLLKSECPNEEILRVLKATKDTKANVILVFKEKIQENAIRPFEDLRSEKLSTITAATQGNKHEFLKKLRENIQQNIDKAEAKPIVNLESYLETSGIQLDDNQQSHSKVAKSIDSWLKMGIREAKNLLKLQMHVPDLANLEREKHSPKFVGEKSRAVSQKRDLDDIYKDIEAVKVAQKESSTQLDKRVLHFLNSIAIMDENDRNCFLNRANHLLNKMSLQVDPQTKEQECSFGLEHIVRELAQLYQLTDIVTIDYAGCAAEMLLSGQPLELLDGDSSYIPIPWFKAVFTKLEDKTKNAKIFVISVLGIQSSGKSTMLNTMFGLEFPVSAGRCTRGAFASLIPVSNSLKAASSYDYVLIIDTEGLQGSGDLHVREHDNELATFVIGVADVTIVNVMGENLNDVKEFLEIAVLAFLKMKLANEKKTCKIVHQNVLAADASKKLSEARSSLKQELDKMTKVAATQENCEDRYQKFDDVISFDEKKDVLYIPSLLNGSPPMAPFNPKYGKAIEDVKKNLIELMCLNERVPLSVSNFQKRVVELWTAMLKENFLFSFRNTIEVRAFTSLDRKYFEESVNLMVIGMAKLESEIQVALERCTTRDEREEEWKSSENLIRNEAHRLGEEMKKKMEKFFETSEDRATLHQWKENVMNRIVELKENQESELNKTCKATFNFLQNQQDVEKMKLDYEKALLERAKDFIFSSNYIGNKDKEKSKEAFEREWQEWIKDVPGCLETRFDTNHEMVKVLCKTNRELGAEISKKLHAQNSVVCAFKTFPPIVNMNQVHIQNQSLFEKCVKIYHYFVPTSQQQQEQQKINLAKSICNEAIDKAINFANTTLKSKARCTSKDLTKMYHLVITTLDEQSQKISLKFHTSVMCDVLLCSFARAYPIFDIMEERYLEERNIRNNLERNLRPKLESYFQNLCDEMEKEVLAANAIFEVLQRPIESALNRAMGLVVTAEIKKKSRYQSKGTFHASVLIELAEKGTFASYIPYFRNPVWFLKEKFKESIQNYCLQQKNDFTSLLKEEAEKIIKNEVLTAISTASKQTKEECGKLTFWIEHFVKNCPTLVIKKDMFAVASMSKDDLKDIGVLDAKLREKLTQFLEILIERGINKTTVQKWDLSPSDQVMTKLFGCQSCCPFCMVFCDQTEKTHCGNHISNIHRPLGLVRYIDLTKNKLSNTICSKCIADSYIFRNADTSGEWHEYQDYQSVNDHYKSWSIDSDPPYEPHIYWQWFMATYSKELADHYEAEQPEIEKYWKKHTVKEITEQLRYEYDIKTEETCK